MLGCLQSHLHAISTDDILLKTCKLFNIKGESIIHENLLTRLSRKTEVRSEVLLLFTFYYDELLYKLEIDH